jgi:chromate transporter
MAIPTFNMMKQANISLLNCWIPIASALLIWGLGVNPVYIILAADIGGYIYGLFLKPSE